MNRNYWLENAEQLRFPPKTKYLAVTLDLETDYATGKTECLDKSGQIVEYLNNKVSNFTVFCEGNIFRVEHPILKELEDAGGDMQLHCNDHRNGPDNISYFKKSLEAYIHYYKKKPLGYRAGNFKMYKTLFQAVKDEGLRWDSSFLPAFKKSTVHKPQKIDDVFIEFPASVWPGTFYPTNMSYCSILGPTIVGGLQKKALNTNYINFTVHLHDLINASSLRNANLKRQLLHNWNYRFGLRDPFKFFKKIIEEFRNMGFTPISLDALYHELKDEIN
jgi:hypothetical protein